MPEQDKKVDPNKAIEPADRETAYLLGSENMKKRLLAAIERRTGLSLEDVTEKLDL